MLFSDVINSKRLIEFMLALIRIATGRKVFHILGNLRVHHIKKITEWIADHKNEIELFHLPPYSTKYNPDEYLNNDLKCNIKSIDELEGNTNVFMNGLSEKPNYMKVYFISLRSRNTN